MILNLFALGFFCLCVLAAARDLSSLIIPNWLNIWIAILFIPAIILAQPGWDVATGHIIVGVVAFILSVMLFMTGTFGGGDAKMIPGVLLWLGPAGVIPFLIGMALVGGLVAVTVLIARQFVPSAAAPQFAYSTLQPKNGVPYGIAIAAGVFLAAPASPLLTGFLTQISIFG